MISLEGIASNLANEERGLAYLKVEHNGQTYDWQLFIPQGVDLSAYISSKEAAIYADIDAKEAAWAVAPKTREIPDPFGGEPTVVDIDKSEVIPTGEFSIGDALILYNSSDKAISLESKVVNSYQSCRMGRRQFFEWPPRGLINVLFVNDDELIVTVGY
jgi:hypothetical protein